MAFRVRVGLVGGHDNTLPRAPEQLGDLAVDRRQALPDVEQEDDDLGLVDRNFGLGLDGRLRLVFGAVKVESRGVDHGELAAAPVGDPVQAVAGQPGLGIDDGLAPAQDAVEQRGLADIGAADDGDDGARHRSIRPERRPQPQEGARRATQNGTN